MWSHYHHTLQVIYGQGTATLELMQDAGDLDVVFLPIGGASSLIQPICFCDNSFSHLCRCNIAGGGLIAGGVLAAKGTNLKKHIQKTSLFNICSLKRIFLV
jgi:threonine dehydratase